MNDGTGACYSAVFDDLRDVYLEDSWVLDVAATSRSIRFALDAVLTPDHPRYRRPETHEQHCYRKAILAVTSVDPIVFVASDQPAARDASGAADYGNIDTFNAVDRDGRQAWKLSGDWGTALVRRPSVTLAFED